MFFYSADNHGSLHCRSQHDCFCECHHKRYLFYNRCGATVGPYWQHNRCRQKEDVTTRRWSRCQVHHHCGQWQRGSIEDYDKWSDHSGNLYCRVAEQWVHRGYREYHACNRWLLSHPEPHPCSQEFLYKERDDYHRCRQRSGEHSYWADAFSSL